MKKKKSKNSDRPNKIMLTILTLGVVVFLAIIFTGGKTSAGSVEIRDGVQYITIDAGGGYDPNLVQAKAGIPTKLLMRTNGVFDCSAFLVIRSVGFQDVLPQKGLKEIDLGTLASGEKIEGTCSMGMYSFRIDFS